MDSRTLQIEHIYNLYKSVHNFKPRHIDFDAMSDDELDIMAAKLAVENEIEMQRAQEY